MARIAIGGFLHETNCFVAMRTDYDYYAMGGEFPPLARGSEVIERTQGTPFGMSGFLDEIGGSHELVPLIWGHGGAGGYITDDCFERIVGELIGRSKRIHQDDIYQCMLDINDIDEKITINKIAKLLRVPKFSEVPYPSIMEPNLVVEYYSR